MDWQGKRKAVTFSYDDGPRQDIRLVEMLNRYGMKGTFHLNSALLGDADGWHLTPDEARRLYRGHEVAGHTLTHPHPEKVSNDTFRFQVEMDLLALRNLTGQPVVGFSYPYGTYFDSAVETLRGLGVQYARTVEATYGFALPKDLLRLPSTCHHKHEKLPELIGRFLSEEAVEPMLLYIWGHSYEFDRDNNWDLMERICERLAGHGDVFYGTNAQVLL